jgi:hypothetical protein
MAIKTTTAIFLSWGLPVPGRERAALEEFSSFVQWATKLQAEGKIERFEVYAPIHGVLQAFAGFTVVEGSEQQIQSIESSQEWKVRVDRVIMVAQGVRIDICDVGEGVAGRMKLYGSTFQQIKL